MGIQLSESPTLNGPGGAGVIGFQSRAAGAAARRADSKLDDFVSLLDFISSAYHSDIIDGSSTQDVSAALQSAIDSGENLHFPGASSAKYLIDGQLLMSIEKQKLVGNGAKLDFRGIDNTKNAIEIQNGGSNRTWQRFGGVRILGDTSAAYASLIYVAEGCTNPYLHDILSEKGTGKGYFGSIADAFIRLAGTPSSYVNSPLLERIFLSSIKSGSAYGPCGFWVEGAIEGAFRDVEAFYFSDCWRLGNATNTSRNVQHCVFDHWQAEPTNPSDVVDGVIGVNIYTAADCTFTNGKADPSNGGGAASRAVKISSGGGGVRNVRFRDCNIQGFTYADYAIECAPAANAYGIYVGGGSIIDFAVARAHKITPGTALSATTNAAGYAIGATSITLAPAGTGAMLAGDGISFAGDAAVYTVTTGVADVSAGGAVVIAAPGLAVAITTAATAVTVGKGQFQIDFDESTSYYGMIPRREKFAARKQPFAAMSVASGPTSNTTTTASLTDVYQPRGTPAIATLDVSSNFSFLEPYYYQPSTTLGTWKVKAFQQTGSTRAIAAGSVLLRPFKKEDIAGTWTFPGTTYAALASAAAASSVYTVPGAALGKKYKAVFVPDSGSIDMQGVILEAYATATANQLTVLRFNAHSSSVTLGTGTLYIHEIAQKFDFTGYATYDLFAVAGIARGTTSVSVSGAALGDQFVAWYDHDQENCIIRPNMASAGTLKFEINNPTLGSPTTGASNKIFYGGYKQPSVI